MIEDVLSALAAARTLAGIAVVTLDPAVRVLASRVGARLIEEGARDGHTGAVAGAAAVLTREGRAAFVTLPGDVPLVTAAEVEQVVAACTDARDIVIVPAHDRRGSNAVLCAPPDVMPLKFGDDSFEPHLAAARRLGLEPKIVSLPGLGLDIDHPADLAAFLRIDAPTRARDLLCEAGLGPQSISSRLGL